MIKMSTMKRHSKKPKNHCFTGFSVFLFPIFDLFDSLGFEIQEIGYYI